MYKVTCSGCNSTYVGQTVRHLATSVDEHRKGDSPVGLHLLESNQEVGGTAELKSEIIDQTANTQKLLTLEASHIWRERPRINRRDEFRSQELTIKKSPSITWLNFKKLTCQNRKCSQIEIL